MLDRTIVLPLCPPLLRHRHAVNMTASLHKHNPNVVLVVNTSEGWKYPCWVCGERGVLWTEVRSKGICRPRNIMHDDCYDSLGMEVRNEFRNADVIHQMKHQARRRSRKSAAAEKRRLARAK